jgi:hypothetical protein
MKLRTLPPVMLALAALSASAIATGCSDDSGGGGGAVGAQDAGGSLVDTGWKPAGDDASGEDTAGGAADSGAQGGGEDSGGGVDCDPYKNTGCPEPQHCIFDSGGTACVDDGAHGLGEDCSDGGGCIEGICVQSQNGSSLCSPFCVSAGSCASKSCNGITGEKYKVCDMASYTGCDPLGAGCATAGQGCYWQGGFVCLQAGATALGEACSSANDCEPGTTCWANKCRKICKIPATGNAGPETGCESIVTPCSSFTSSAGYCDE